jgi:hypothetical protein
MQNVFPESEYCFNAGSGGVRNRVKTTWRKNRMAVFKIIGNTCTAEPGDKKSVGCQLILAGITAFIYYIIP